MRRFLAVWLSLWAVTAIVGLALSAVLFRHVDLSFSALCALVIVPVGQAAMLLAPGLVVSRRHRPRPGSAERARIDPRAAALLITVVVMLQLVWLAVGSRLAEIAESIVLRHVVALHAAGIAVLSLREVVRNHLGGRWPAAAVGGGALVGGLEVYVDSVPLLRTVPGLPPLIYQLLVVLLTVVLFVGLSALTARFAAHDRAAGRMAELSLGCLFGSALIAVAYLHGGGQLGAFWWRAALTLVLVAAAVLIAAWLQTWQPAPGGSQLVRRSFWWQGGVVRKLQLLAGCYVTFVVGQALVGWWFGSLPGLPGESVTRAAVIPGAQAAALIALVGWTTRLGARRSARRRRRAA